MPAFDAYSLVDFSARSTPSSVKPSADACWLGTLTPGQRFRAEYFRTRQEAMNAWSRWVSQQDTQQRRVLAGFDFAFGTPRNFAAAARLSPGNPGWRALWGFLAKHIQDDGTNRNNRFAIAAAMNARVGREPSGPWWGGPPSRLAGLETLRTKRGFTWPYPVTAKQTVARLRETDRRARGAQEVWKLAGIGSVGSQSLLGIAGLASRRIGPTRAPWASRAAVWPMETGFKLPSRHDRGKRVVLVEAFPSLLPQHTQAKLNKHHGIRDAAQVDAWCHWARRLDRRNQLDPLFERPADLTDAEHQACLDEEGWIFGVT
ncbi:MAG: hypothetical protein AAF328_02700 [Planctomycetota bacterium]